MMRTRIWITVLALAGAVVCVFLSTLGHDAVKAMLDARSADGDVESYTIRFHASFQMRLRLFAAIGVILTTGLLLARARFDRAAARVAGDARTFLSDVRAAITLLWKSTRGGERWAVLVLLVIAAALRIAQLDKAVIYDEAFTCTYYAVRPWYIIVTDYSYPNNHILHTLLVKCSLALFGWGEAQARIPAFCAGMAAPLLCWAWVRSTFGNNVAYFTMALLAISGPLIHYSALARGYSITWACFMVSLLLARHFVRSGNAFAGIMVALVNALGMWSVPTMIYGSATVYVWLLIQPSSGSTADRMGLFRSVLVSGSTFVLFTLVLYAPVIAVHGPGQLFYDETMGPRSWAHLTGSIAHRTHEFNDALFNGWAVVLGIPVLLAAILSRTYLRFAITLTTATLLLVLLQRMMGPPRIWWFALFVVLAAPGVLLQQLQRWANAQGWQPRFIHGSLVYIGSMALVLALASVRRSGALHRFPGVEEATIWFIEHLEPTDRVLVNVPCEAPMEFYFKKHGMGIDPLYRKPTPGGRLWFVVGKGYDHSFEALATRAHLPAGSWSDPRPVRDLDGLTIFAARFP